ncbi:MAG: L-2-amino-thiazoline-4-carboxylic acid hydrolase [Phycisphaerae bacterium]|nr:L-2-amino-thiazoline-4-carboxylic acid hydrolase [Phycisphaerae bacterium]
MNDKFREKVLSPINGEIAGQFEKAVSGLVRLYCSSLTSVVRAIEARYGDEGKEVARQGFLAELNRKAREAEAEGGKGDVQAFCAGLEETCMYTHDWDRLIDDDDKVAYQFTRCMWAEEFRKLGAPDIGKWLCDTDEPAAKAAKLKFKRTRTIIDGDEICDHIFYVE